MLTNSPPVASLLSGRILDRRKLDSVFLAVYHLHIFRAVDWQDVQRENGCVRMNGQFL